MSADPRDGAPADLASQPAAGLAELPPALDRLVGDAAWTALWRNQTGGLTLRTTFRGRDAALKWQPGGALDLAAEAERLRWAHRYHPVPEVLGVGHDEGDGWLATAMIDARSAVDPVWIARPETAVAALGAGLRALHDALPVEGCPFRVDAPGLPEPDRLVVAHADPCPPNTLLDDDGRWVAHVDLGLLGVADRWLDLAVGSMAVGWNYGDGWEDLYFRSYGVERDEPRIRAWRDWWHAGGDDANLPSVRAARLD